MVQMIISRKNMCLSPAIFDREHLGAELSLEQESGRFVVKRLQISRTPPLITVDTNIGAHASLFA